MAKQKAVKIDSCLFSEMLQQLKIQRIWLRHIRPQINTSQPILLGFDQAEESLSAVINKAEAK